jgi:glycosyltransferase 2 family protein
MIARVMPPLRAKQDATGDRSWGIALLVPAARAPRNRRPIEVALIAIAALVAGLAAVVAKSAPEVDDSVGEALDAVIGWAPYFWRLVFVLALALALVIVVDVVVRRRWRLTSDLLVAVVVVASAGVFLERIVTTKWFQAEAHVFSNWGFPELRLASAVAIFAVAGPELVRPVRLLSAWLVALGALGGIVLDVGTMSQVLGALAVGLGAAALVRLTFGSAAGMPSIDRVRLALASLGVTADDLSVSQRQRIGAAEFVGHDPNGSPLKVRVLGRDAQDTQRLVRRWRLLAYRDPPRSAPIGRLEQVEHEAVATLMAAQAGVRVPEMVTVGLSPEDDAVVVTRQPDVQPLEFAGPDQVSDGVLEDLWRQAERLHTAGISHGRLNASNVLVTDGKPMLVDLSAATLGAPASSLDMDVAELLVACAILVGPDRALGRALAAGPADAIARALPYLQRAALTPHLRDLARSHEVDLKELRSAAAAATGNEAPEVVSLYRVRPKDVLLMVVLIFAAYLLISQLAEIGFGTISHELARADVAWVVFALILAQCSFIGSGISVRGAVATPLPLLPCVVLQSAIKFINLTVPSSAGRIGMNLRFMQRMGVPRAQAVAAGAVDDLSETIVQVGLFLLVLPFVSVDVDTSQFHFKPDQRLLEALAIALVVSAVVAFAVPKVRARVVPEIKSGLSGLWSVARVRQKRVELFGGNIASELTYALALGATCLAYGVHLNLAQLVLANTAASVLSSLIPVPGGIGAAEASLSAALIAMGVDKPTAFAIALTQRLCTFYLPPIWGFASLRWLSRKGYL